MAGHGHRPQATLTTGYLSDQAWTAATNGWGLVERDKSNGEQAAGDGVAISLNAKKSTKGLGVHAASEIRYAINGGCSSFQAVVGLDDEVRKQSRYGSAVFQVFANGTKLYDSGKLTLTSAAQAVSLDLSGRNELQLSVTTSGDNNYYDHADWADARVTCGAVTPPLLPVPLGPNERFLTDLTPTSALNGLGPVETNTSNGGLQPGDGRTMSLRSQAFARGLGVHANSDVRYALNGQCQNFRDIVGVDDETLGKGTVVFQVWTDGAQLYNSATVKPTSAALGVNVALAGAQE